MEHRRVHRKRQNTFKPTVSYPLPGSSSSDTSSTSSTTSSFSSSSSSTSTSSSTSSTSSTSTTTSSTSSTTSSTSSVSTLDVPQTISVLPTQSTVSLTSSTSSASSSPTPGNTNVTGAAKTSTGTIVGIVLAVVLGVAVLWIVVAFIQRRLRNRARDRYDPDSFMRQSVILPDNDSSAPVIGTRNALALARANMGLGDPAPGPQPFAAQYEGGATYFAEEPGYAPHVYTPSPGYDPSQLTRRPSTGAADMRQMYPGPYPPPSMQQYPYGNTAPMHAQEANAQGYGSQEQHPNEVARNELTQPASVHLANSSGHGQDADDASPFSDPVPSGGSAQPLGRTLSRSYGSLSPASPVAPHTTRSGTPVEANPQQTYLTPALPVAHPEPAVRPEAPRHDQYNGPVRANVSRETVYEADDAYGGI
ncbi:hypothetical protein BS47DRAFT_1043185 [Hydnum rufescens UP504]|uniref:Uncharacterized protein n=1 Tax=Hydnum rufescens UP504 TaxID=1448309 RepID=A0A9P6AVC4_9AGAM|nr:hypothetical protein BS47DRAFT_1043185 [Hydnum rufescens UP504]